MAWVGIGLELTWSLHYHACNLYGERLLWALRYYLETLALWEMED